MGQRWREDGALSNALRIYLTGAVCVESGATLLREDRFPGTQGRVVFAMLAAEHDRAVSHDELAQELWGEAPPAAWDTALRSIVSKLRGLLSEAGLDGESVAGAFGAYRLRLPAGAWVDVEAAAEAIHRAEPALRDGDLREAVGWGRVASSVGAREFLPGAGGPWTQGRRTQLREIRIRALECLGKVWLETRDFGQAARDAEEALRLDPFRESSCRLLMRALAARGNRADALLAYERFRTAVADELGADPAAETEEVYLEVLRST